MARQILSAKMTDRRLQIGQIATLLALLLGNFILQACERSKRADHTIYVCFDRAGDAGRAVGLLRQVSDRFDYRLREYGGQAKSDLDTIDSRSAVIPEGEPIHADIENRDGEVVLIASNFGSIGEDLRVSFFYRRDEGEGSPFHLAVVSGLAAIEGANLNLSAAETGANPCGEN